MLFKTTKLNGSTRGHDHIAYLPVSDDGRVLRTESRTTENKGHFHAVSFQQPTEEDPGGWVIYPSEDGHTHEILGDVERTGEKEDGTEEERVTRVRELFKFAKEFEGESREDAEESEEFYTGKQWDDNDKSYLESSRRACLTINLIQPSIDLLSGYQRQNRSDIRFFPVEQGDARAADIYTAVVKNVCERNDYAHQETLVFEDAAIAGRGVLHCYVDYDRAIEGDIVIEHYPWDEFYAGPHEKEDLSDCEHTHKAKWFSKDKIKQLWPDKADDIQKDFEAHMEPEPHMRYEGLQYEKSTNTVPVVGPDFIDIAKKEYRVIECEERVYRRIPMLVNATDGFVLNGDGMKASDISAVKKIDGFSVIYRRIDKMRKTAIAGNVLLSDEIVDDEDFSCIPAYAKKRGGRWYGKVLPVLDAQRELNKRHSQAVDIVNKMGSYGYFYTEGTFANPTEERKFIENSSSPGFTVKVSNLTQKPQKEEGVKFPAEIAQLEAMAKQSIHDILNIQPEMLGRSGEVRSGVALAQQQKQGLIGNEFLFDNLNYAKKQLGKRLVKYIQEIYTPERILRILDNQNRRAPVDIGGQPLDAYPREELVALLSNQDATKFDIVVGESAYSPTMMMTNYTMLIQAAQAGIPIPPDLLLQSSPLPEEAKNKALQSLAASQQQQAAQQQQKTQMEIEKSLPDEIKVPLYLQRQQAAAQAPVPPANMQPGSTA